MSNETNSSEKDFTSNWVSSSRFLFYIQVFCILSFVLGGCYRMYHQKYPGNQILKFKEVQNILLNINKFEKKFCQELQSTIFALPI